MRSRLPVIALITALSACGGQQALLPDVAKPVVTTASVPVPIECIDKDKVPAHPRWETDALAPEADEFDRAKALRIDNDQRRQYVPKLEAIIAGCASSNQPQQGVAR